MQQLIPKIIDLLKLQKLDDYEIDISQSIGTSTSIRLGEIENLQQHQNQSLDIHVYCGGKAGHASTVDLSLVGIKKTITNATNIAKYTKIDVFNSLAPKALMAFEVPDLDLFHPWELSNNTAIQLAKECEENALSNPKITNSEGAEVASFSGTNWYLNSNDLIASMRSSRHSISCSLIAEKNNEKQTAYEYDSVLDYKDLQKPAIIGKKAANNTIDKLGATLIKSGHYPIIFTNKTSSGLIASVLSALSGGTQYKKSTFLYDSLQQIILPENINIIEQPLAIKTIGSKAFDDDGVLKKTQKFIDNGRVVSYIMGQYSANQMKLQTTGNAGGVNNIVVPATKKINLQNLIKEMNNGVVIDELMGQGINLITGDYSRGAGGFLVKNGEITQRISGITIAGNLKQMIKDIITIADDPDQQTNIKVGSILIKDMMVAGL